MKRYALVVFLLSSFVSLCFSQQQCDGGIIYEPKAAFKASAPEGWSLAIEAGSDHGVVVLAANREGTAPSKDFTSFWNRFKSAVASSDKSPVAELTSFPFSIYDSQIKNRADFLRRYNEIFNGEANAWQCFATAEPQKESARSYSVYCPFKQTPNDRENAPIRFIFEITKTGWKFTGLDNINE